MADIPWTERDDNSPVLSFPGGRFKPISASNLRFLREYDLRAIARMLSELGDVSIEEEIEVMNKIT
ncbi:hypothetical protein ACP70R_040715 [Stipagrostis hirtigluma subsp. patula]